MSGGYHKSSNDLNQGSLFVDMASPAPVVRDGFVQFREPSEATLVVGAVPLRQYLKDIGDELPLMLFELLKGLDWSEFEKDYSGVGRKPYAPRLMVGIILYGILQNQFSLRGLERLAARDLGCVWVAAGIRPDHSCLGKFINRHENVLSTEFFEQLTSQVLKLTGANAKECAIDGTMVQAAASRYRTVKREALDRKLANAREKASSETKGAKALQRYEKADQALTEREEARKAQRKSADTLRVSTTEPEAPVQPLKNKSFAPAYKPSVIANKERIVTATEVDPSSESAVVAKMLEQSEKVSGEAVEELLGDAGYCNEAVINATLNRDASLLAPETSNNEAPKAFSKKNFRYDESQDAYICPAGKLLGRYTKNANGYVGYRGADCAGCEFFKLCIKGKKAKFRIVKRYPVDEAKDALREVMQQPRAQQRYRQRKAMVEPVFAYINGHLGLRRFRRKGLSKARMEFALYAAANNVARLFALSGKNGAASRAVLALLWTLLRPWRILFGQRGDFRPIWSFFEFYVGDPNCLSPKTA